MPASRASSRCRRWASSRPGSTSSTCSIASTKSGTARASGSARRSSASGAPCSSASRRNSARDAAARLPGAPLCYAGRHSFEHAERVVLTADGETTERPSSAAGAEDAPPYAPPAVSAEERWPHPRPPTFGQRAASLAGSALSHAGVLAALLLLAPIEQMLEGPPVVEIPVELIVDRAEQPASAAQAAAPVAVELPPEPNVTAEADY